MDKDIPLRPSWRHQLWSLALAIAALLFVSVGLHAQTAYKWEIFTTLNHGRQQFATAWIGNDQLVVIGGKIDSDGQLTGTPTTSCEVVDVGSASAYEVAPMNTPRAEHTALADAVDSSIVVTAGVITAGNRGDITASVERYQPDTDVWSEVGDLLVPRRQHAAYWLNADEIMVVGGRNKNLTSLTSAEIFNVRTGASRQVADFPYPISTAEAVVSGEYAGVVVGGRSGGAGSDRSSLGYRYNSTLDQWDVAFDLGQPIVRPSVLGLWQGPVILTGGSYDESPFDASSGVWQIDNGGVDSLGTMTHGRQWHGIAQLSTDSVIVGGGYHDGPIIVNSCDWVNVASGSVVPGPALNIARSYTEFVSIPTYFGSQGEPTEAFVVCVGGLRGDGQNEAQVEILVRTCEGPLDLLSENVPKNLLGSARLEDTSLMLTDTTTFTRGAAWVRRRVTIEPSFDMSFSFVLDEGNDHDLPDGGPVGADGIVVVIQNVVPSGIGDVGRGIGYDGIAHGVAIEFDSYENAAFSDPSGSHVAVQVGDGRKLYASHTPDNNVALATDGVPEFIADGRTYYARVLWVDDLLRVWVSDDEPLGDPVITVGIDLVEELKIDADGRAWVGLTSSTGFSSEIHEVTAWSLETCDAILVGVEEEGLFSTSTLLIAPSPADQQAVVTLPSSLAGGWTLRVVSMDGRTVFATDGVDAASQPLLPASTLAPGMYAVVVASGQRTWSAMWSVVR